MVVNDRKNNTNKNNDKKSINTSINSIQGVNNIKKNNCISASVDSKKFEKEDKCQGKIKKFKSSLLNDIPADCLVDQKMKKQTVSLGAKKGDVYSVGAKKGDVYSRGSDFVHDRNMNYSSKRGYNENIHSNNSNSNLFSASKHSGMPSGNQGEVHSSGLVNTGYFSLFMPYWL
jgi:hypothetical protein